MPFWLKHGLSKLQLELHGVHVILAEFFHPPTLLLSCTAVLQPCAWHVPGLGMVPGTPPIVVCDAAVVGYMLRNEFVFPPV